MKKQILVLLIAAAVSTVSAQSPSTHSGNYGPDSIGDSVPERNVGSFSISSSSSQPMTFVATIEYNITDINNDSDIQSFLHVSGGSIAHSVDRVPGPVVASRQNVMTLVGQSVVAPGTHPVVLRVGRIGSVDSYDVSGRWVCTVVRFGESSLALANAVDDLQAADASMRAALQSQIDALEVIAVQETANLQAQVDVLNGQIGTLQERAQHLETRIVIQEEFKDVLEAELDLVHLQIQSLQGELAWHQQWLSDHETRLWAVEQALADANARLGDAENRLGETQGALSQTQADLASTQDLLGQTQNQLSGTQGVLDQTRADLAETQENLAITQGNLVTTQGDLAATQADLSGTQSALSGVQNELVGTQSGLISAQEDIARLQAEALRNANAARVTSNNFRETIVTLRDRIRDSSQIDRDLEQEIAGLPTQKDYNDLLQRFEDMPGEKEYQHILKQINRETSVAAPSQGIETYLIPIGASLGGSFIMDLFFNHSAETSEASGSVPAASYAPSQPAENRGSWFQSERTVKQSIPYKR